MGAYNIVNPAALVAGQPENVGDVYANLQAIQAILNGGIDNSNINAAAAIAYSKLALGSSIARADMAAGNKTTVSTFAGGPPGSPSDGDIWIATAVDTIGTRWTFQYNAGSASAYKWECIGGPPRTTGIITVENTTSTVFADLATVGPSYTIVRAGDYITDFGATAFTTGASNLGNAETAIAKNGSVVGVGALCNMPNIGGAAISMSSKNHPQYVGGVAGLAAGDVLKMQYFISNGANTGFGSRWLAITPMRIA